MLLELLGSPAFQLVNVAGVPSVHSHVPSDAWSVNPIQRRRSEPPRLPKFWSTQSFSAWSPIDTRCPPSWTANASADVHVVAATAMYRWPFAGLVTSASGGTCAMVSVPVPKAVLAYAPIRTRYCWPADAANCSLLAYAAVPPPQPEAHVHPAESSLQPSALPGAGHEQPAYTAITVSNVVDPQRLASTMPDAGAVQQNHTSRYGWPPPQPVCRMPSLVAPTVVKGVLPQPWIGVGAAHESLCADANGASTSMARAAASRCMGRLLDRGPVPRAPRGRL